MICDQAIEPPGKARDGLQGRCGEGIAVEGLHRIPQEYFVIWSGEPFAGRDNSRMGRVLACVTELGVPLSLRVLAQRAAHLTVKPLQPDELRNCLRQHQLSRQVVLLLVERSAAGDFAAVTDVPFGAAGFPRLRRGDIVSAAAARGASARTTASDTGPLCGRADVASRIGRVALPGVRIEG